MAFTACHFPYFMAFNLGGSEDAVTVSDSELTLGAITSNVEIILCRDKA